MPVAKGLYYFLQQSDKADILPIILIHGAGGMHLYWPPQIRRLAGYRVLAVDLPGHGKSHGDRGCQSIEEYSRHVLEWLDALGLYQAVFVGHSMGSAVALMLGLEHPERALGLVLVGSGAQLPVNSALLEEASNPATYPNAVELVVKWSFSPDTPDNLTELARRRMMETRQSVFYCDLLACNTFDVKDHLEIIKCPVLIICGEHDRMTPVRTAQYLATVIPGAQLEIVPGAGHMVMLERPEVVASHISDFMAQIQYQRGDTA